jgi:catechol 2,3-dioxygenase-like lactoylglutathione lyase family enzyme
MIDHIDHIVLTTRDLAACIRFYTEALGMQLERFRTPTEERLALKFGNQKINLHEWGREFSPRAHVAVPGSLDLCFICSMPLADVVKDAGKKRHSHHRRPRRQDRRGVEAALGVRARSGPEPGRNLRAGVTKNVVRP